MYRLVQIVIYVTLYLCNCQGVTVQTKLGQITGFQKNVTIQDGGTKPISIFYGIPFAETTSGSNRFMKPQPRAPFTETFDATDVPSACIQATSSSAKTYSRFGNFTEDCLQLNVYVPGDMNDQWNLPVMVWVYGGGFVEGAAGVYRSEGLSAVGNVIVVTVNYRLGMFGFLRSSDGKFMGNQGLWDQHLAFQWVHDNIADFGGNVNNVTIFGESAGAASVLLQAIYPGNRGLFQRVIAESGSALGYYAFQEPNAERYLKETKCATVTDPMVCLQNETPEALQIDIGFIYNESLAFRPTVDDDFLKGTPREILLGDDPRFSNERAFFASLDIAIGVNNYEGASFLLGLDLPDDFQTNEFNMSRALFDDAVEYYIDNFMKPENDKVKEMLRMMIEYTYIDYAKPDDGNILRENMVNIASDITMFAPAIATANAHARYLDGRTYVYFFTAKPGLHINPGTPDWINGANHADELDFVFAWPLTGEGIRVGHNYTDDEVGLSRAVATLWSNFATTGNPNFPITSDPRYSSTDWPEYNMDAQQFIDLGMTGATVSERFFPQRMQLWNHLIPHLKNVILSSEHTNPLPTAFVPIDEMVGK